MTAPWNLEPQAAPSCFYLDFWICVSFNSLKRSFLKTRNNELKEIEPKDLLINVRTKNWKNLHFQDVQLYRLLKIHERAFCGTWCWLIAMNIALWKKWRSYFAIISQFGNNWRVEIYRSIVKICREVCKRNVLKPSSRADILILLFPCCKEMRLRNAGLVRHLKSPWNVHLKF